GERKARHRLEASRPSFEVGPVGDLKPALGHECHAAPTADIGNRAIIADEEWLVFDCLVDKGKCGLRARAKFGDRLRVRSAKSCRVAHLGDISDMVGLPRQPFACLPALLLGSALEVPGLARQVVEDQAKAEAGY